MTKINLRPVYTLALTDENTGAPWSLHFSMPLDPTGPDADGKVTLVPPLDDMPAVTFSLAQWAAGMSGLMAALMADVGGVMAVTGDANGQQVSIVLPDQD